jgi:MoaA/NifB/PqqE/SkfB family radical SAM enzyme
VYLRNFSRYVGKVLGQPVYAFSVAGKRLKAYFYYLFSRGYAVLPEAVTLFLTHRCNLRCKMCGQWGDLGVTKKMAAREIKQEFSLEELKQLIDSFAEFKPNITLFGGEPLLYPECWDLIKYIKSKNMHCLMITNGALIRGQVKELVGSDIDELNVSLDGGEILHDQIRGLPGVFNKITSGLKELAELKKERGLKRPLVNLQCTITQYNYQHLEQLIDVAGQVSADALTFHNLIFLNEQALDEQKQYDRQLSADSGDWQGFVVVPQIDPDQLFSKIAGILSKKYSFSVDFYPNFSQAQLRKYYQDKQYIPPVQVCLSPWIVGYIFPDGEVKPCLNSTYSFGNIMTDDFKAVWNSQKAISFRRILKQTGIFPVCTRCTELYRY